MQCLKSDPNSYCSSYSLRFLCVCKNNYRVSLVNNTERCIYSSYTEDEREGLTAAPIILCFLVCVLVEAFCLLAFRYWKKRRRTSVTRHGALHLQTVTLSEFSRFSHSRSDPIVSFAIAPAMDSVISSTHLASPPPYSQTVIVDTSLVSQREEPPPPYDEAVKQYTAFTKLSSEEYNHRKLSF
nr:uncharacterized protein LOC107439413 isoform X2 [Parasteatoda tepidariorum]